LAQVGAGSRIRWSNAFVDSDIAAICPEAARCVQPSLGHVGVPDIVLPRQDTEQAFIRTKIPVIVVR
jgi:hypothetical protein